MGGSLLCFYGLFLMLLFSVVFVPSALRGVFVLSSWGVFSLGFLVAAYYLFCLVLLGLRWLFGVAVLFFLVGVISQSGELFLAGVMAAVVGWVLMGEVTGKCLEVCTFSFLYWFFVELVGLNWGIFLNWYSLTGCWFTHCMDEESIIRSYLIKKVGKNDSALGFFGFTNLVFFNCRFLDYSILIHYTGYKVNFFGIFCFFAIVTCFFAGSLSGMLSLFASFFGFCSLTGLGAFGIIFVIVIIGTTGS